MSFAYKSLEVNNYDIIDALRKNPYQQKKGMSCFWQKRTPTHICKLLSNGHISKGQIMKLFLSCPKVKMAD
jgi:hypothetical protein